MCEIEERANRSFLDLFNEIEVQTVRLQAFAHALTEVLEEVPLGETMAESAVSVLVDSMVVTLKDLHAIEEQAFRARKFEREEATVSQ